MSGVQAPPANRIAERWWAHRCTSCTPAHAGLMRMLLVTRGGPLVDQSPSRTEESSRLHGCRDLTRVCDGGQTVHALVRPRLKHSRHGCKLLELWDLPTGCPRWMFKQEMSSCGHPFPHQLCAKPHMSSCRFELNLKRLFPLVALRRDVKILQSAEYGTRGGADYESGTG